MRSRIARVIGGCFFSLVAIAVAAVAAADSTDYSLFSRYGYFRARLNETVDPCENFYDFACSKFDGTYKNTLEGVSVSSIMLLDVQRLALFFRKLGVLINVKLPNVGAKAIF